MSRSRVEPIQQEYADFWTIVSSLDEAALLIDEAGRSDVGLIYDAWHLWNQPVEQIERNRDRIVAVHLSDWRDRLGTRTTASCRAMVSSTFAPDRRGASVGRALRPRDLFRPGAAGLALERRPAGARAPRSGGAVTRVCVVGAGVIGSLYAAHLARVTEVSVLCRREEHARH